MRARSPTKIAVFSKWYLVNTNMFKHVYKRYVHWNSVSEWHPFNTRPLPKRGEVTSRSPSLVWNHNCLAIYRPVWRAQCARPKRMSIIALWKRVRRVHRLSIDCAWFYRFRFLFISVQSLPLLERQNNICYNNNFVFVLVLESESLNGKISIDS